MQQIKIDGNKKIIEQFTYIPPGIQTSQFPLACQNVTTYTKDLPNHCACNYGKIWKKVPNIPNKYSCQ